MEKTIEQFRNEIIIFMDTKEIIMPRLSTFSFWTDLKSFIRNNEEIY